MQSFVSNVESGYRILNKTGEDVTAASIEKYDLIFIRFSLVFFVDFPLIFYYLHISFISLFSSYSFLLHPPSLSYEVPSILHLFRSILLFFSTSHYLSFLNFFFFNINPKNKINNPFFFAE